MLEDYDLSEFDGVCRLFPLEGVVLFPHAVLPLHIFEPRYRQMTEDALAGDGLIAIVQTLADGEENPDGEPAIEAVACLGKILQHQRLPDGRFNFLLRGQWRVRIVAELDAPTLYRQARVDILSDLEPLAESSAERAELVALYRAIARRVGGLSDEMDAMLDADPALRVVTDLLAQSLGLPPALKQALLDDRRVDRRADTLLTILRQVAGQLGLGPDGPRPSPPAFSDN